MPPTPERGLAGLTGVVLGLVLWTSACSTSEPPDAAAPGTAQETAVAESDEPAGRDPEPAGTGNGGRRGPIDSDEFVGLGELALLPALLQSFGAGIDCDFDDALSTCQ